MTEHITASTPLVCSDERHAAKVAALEAEVARWLAFIERGMDTHTQFSLLKPDGTTEELPCADWCYACRVEKAETGRNGAYRERAHLVALLAALYPAHIGYTDPAAVDWLVVTIETPTGQMSWHIAERDRDLFEHVRLVPSVHNVWDGHSTEEKYVRLRALTAAAVEQRDQLATALREVLAAFSTTAHAEPGSPPIGYFAESPVHPDDMERWRAALPKEA